MAIVSLPHRAADHQDQDRKLILVRDVERHCRSHKAVPHAERGEDDALEVALAGAEAWFKSACSVLVGTPVEGPARMTLMMTAGVSNMADMPIASVISANPPPEVAHIARTPMWLAPIHMLTTEISSSPCRTPDTEPLRVIREPLQDVRGGAHRIGDVELAPGQGGAIARRSLPEDCAHFCSVGWSGVASGWKFLAA